MSIMHCGSIMDSLPVSLSIIKLIFGPSPSSPVAFDGSNAEIYDNTWSAFHEGV